MIPYRAPMPSQDAPTEPVRVPSLPPPLPAHRPPMTLTRIVAYWCAALTVLSAVLFVFTYDYEEIRHPADAVGFVFVFIFGTIANFVGLFVLAVLAIAGFRGVRAFLRWINRRPAP